MMNKENPYIRYMDDIWVFGNNEDELWDLLLQIDNFATERGLCVNPKKTIIAEFSEELDLIDMEPSGLHIGMEVILVWEAGPGGQQVPRFMAKRA